MKFLKPTIYTVIILFAIIGMVFSAVFIAMKFGLLNVRGSIDVRNDSIIGIESEGLEKSITKKNTAPDYSCVSGSNSCEWSETREWEVVAGGLAKDVALINRVAKETNVSPRLIAAVVIPEQIRFFTSNREVFKRYFEPLKILGSLSEFSLGVSGIKQDTAEKIEQYALDINSVFYPGDGYAQLVAYDEGQNHDSELYDRLTNDKDHYYSYLYTALFIKEILMQWERAGYDISNQPAVVATIFNLGFTNSQPKPNPVVAGTVVKLGGTNYSFGTLGGLFYESEQLEFLVR